MNNSEIFAVIRTQIAEVKEIPPPIGPAAVSPHEPKPYRDPYLYVTCPPEKWFECAKVLKSAGAKYIKALVIARG